MRIRAERDALIRGRTGGNVARSAAWRLGAAALEGEVGH